MLAGMQLEVFTPLQHGPMTAEQIADAIGVAPPRLPLLLYALVAAGLLTKQDGQFANTSEAEHGMMSAAPETPRCVLSRLSVMWYGAGGADYEVDSVTRV